MRRTRPKPEATEAASPTPWRADAAPERASVAGTQLIGKAFALLDAIGAAPGLVTVPQLVKATGWPRATLYRILQAITAHGFVRFDPVAQGYTLGYRFLELAQNVWAAPDLAAVASVELQRLRDATGETAYLAVPSEASVVALGKFESPHDRRSSARLGVSKPMHCTSQGKAILAHLGAAEAARLLGPGPYERFTEHTITDPARLGAQLAVIRARGYAIDDEEIVLGTRCVGAAVLRGRDAVAAISVAGPAYRLTPERVEQLGPEIALAARNIGLKLRASGGAAGIASPNAHPHDDRAAFYGAHPSWDAAGRRLLWVDRLGPSLYATGETLEAWHPEPAAPIDALVAAPDGVRLALGGGLLRLQGDALAASGRAPAGLTALAAAPDGRLWSVCVTEAGSAIAPFEADRPSTPLLTLPGAASALAWSPGGDRLYVADRKRGTIHVVASATGRARLLARIPGGSGEPAGLAVDAEDRLWVALYDGWALARLDEDGDFERVVPLPVPRPTALAFGGPELSTLFVTTARIGLARDVQDNAPLSGRLLVVDAGVAGWASR